MLNTNKHTKLNLNQTNSELEQLLSSTEQFW